VEWGILFILFILLFVGFVVVQGTMAQLKWRSLVAEGDVDAIRQLVEAEVEQWHSARVPRGVPALLWHGIQTVEVTEIDANGARVNCSGEGEYALIDGRRVETSSPLAEGMKITMKLAEMMLYDIPNVKLDHVQIDVYTSFRDDSGRAEPRCVLSTRVERRMVEHIDWEETQPVDFVALNDGRFAGSDDGRLTAVEPLPWTDGAKERG
jgi:hypothetical protein